MHDSNVLQRDRKGLREFGLTTGGLIAVLFGVVFPWLLDAAFPLWPWLICAVLALWALLAPDTMQPLYYWWMRFGLLLNRITTPLILGIVYFVVLTPIALIFKMVGRDAMARKFNTTAQSYRVLSKKISKSSMEKPF